jgi:DUF1680 family protein
MTMGGGRVRVTQRTNYPWDGDIELRVEPDARRTFTLAVRVPGWTRGQPVASDLYRFHHSALPAPTLIVNGEARPIALDRGFARVTREWRPGDVVHVHLPMPVQRVLAHDAVVENRGRAALQRGPLVYALEGVDNGTQLDALELPLDAEIDRAFRRDLLGGVEVLTAAGRLKGAAAARPVLAVPYFAWANRAPGEMVVWMRTGQ